jgi:hypothetical protein
MGGLGLFCSALPSGAASIEERALVMMLVIVPATPVPAALLLMDTC